MKFIKIFFFLFSLTLVQKAHAQYKWWGGYTINEVVDKADLVFEGRILTDTPFFQSAPGDVFSRHQVLVLKQFKGNFTSDTITVITGGGKMVLNGQDVGSPRNYGFKDEEAVIFATNSQKVELGGNDPNAYWPFYGPGVSYVTVCNKKDVVKEVYEPIEQVTGQPYVDVHPNTCATQQKK